MNKLKQLFDLQKERNAISDKMNTLRNELVNDISPYKPGDIVPAKSYTHTGKNVIIDSVTMTMQQDQIGITVYGTRLNTQGLRTATEVKWTNKQDDKIEKALRKALSKIAT